MALAADAHALKRRRLEQALHRAGIDGATWDPEAGVDANRDTITRVYRYYGGLYLAHEFLRWAGMACMIGPAFYAGFRDLAVIPDAARRAVGFVFGGVSRKLAQWAAGDLGFYETTFLTMQKKIFEDQSVMHEAYLDGGLAAIDELRDAGVIDDATQDAWRRIDFGRRNDDSVSIDDGNRTLLFREQHDIIDSFYLRMFDHRPVGRLFTYLLTLVGTPSVPGAKSFAEVFPLALTVPLPARRMLSVATPLPDGNIALFANRWGLIEVDTLPAYLGLVEEHDGDARALLETPIDYRVARFRLLARVCDLATAVFTHWRVHLSRRPVAEAQTAIPSSAPSKAPRVAKPTIDLTRALDRNEAGLPLGRDHRIWHNSDRKPVYVSVALPGGRVFQAHAEHVVLLASRHRGNPDRLVVSLPRLTLDDTRALMLGYAAEWQFQTQDVHGWSTHSQLQARRDGDYRNRTYSTHVFTAEPAGSVTLQFQVAHHIREGEFAVEALFTWGAAAVVHR